MNTSFPFLRETTKPYQNEVIYYVFFNIDRQLKICRNKNAEISYDNNSRKQKIFEFLNILKRMKLPLWAYYLRIMTNYSCNNIDKNKNIILRWGQIILRVIFIILIHSILFLYFSVENFFVFVVLANETILVIAELKTRKDNHEIEMSKVDSVKKLNELEEQEKEVVLRAENCVKRWFLFLIYIFLKKLVVIIEINKYYLVIPKIIYTIYLTS